MDTNNWPHNTVTSNHLLQNLTNTHLLPSLKNFHSTIWEKQQRLWKSCRHAFISSKVNYSNVLFTGLTIKTIRQLQLIQADAARVIIHIKKEHITPALQSLVSNRSRVQLKVLLIVY